MSRWSLSNFFRAVTHKQFVDYVQQFKQASEKSFGTECQLQIKALTAPKVYTTFVDDHIQSELDAQNNRNTLGVVNDVSEVTPEMWNDAGYVGVTIRPVDKNKAPDYAFAHAEFKGTLPKQATFYIQPDTKEVKNAMISNNSKKRVGDGFESNGTRSQAIPLGIGFGI